jgi:hypothetical protein
VSEFDWISKFLRKRGYEAPTKEPLFTYHLTEEEYLSLKHKLQQYSSTVSFKNQTWCAEFCIFSSEWYRREYVSGWSWTGIFNELRFIIDANHRADVVVKGMAFWGRPINRYDSDRNDYLGTVCREGGLPFGLLAADGSRFQLLFKHLLSDFDRAKAFGLSPIPAIELQLEKMPDAFQAESTVILLNDMVAHLYLLIDTYSLDKQTEPSSYLDSMAPKWRSNFPIPLDATTGNEFLAGLLKSATHQRKENKKRLDRLNLIHWLSNVSSLAFSAEIKLNNQFSLPLKKDDLSGPMVEVCILEGNQKIADFGLARAELNGQGIVLNMRKTLVEFRRENLSSLLKLVVTQAGRVRYSEELSLSSLPLNEMPVILDNTDGKKLVIGLGSVSKKTDSLIAIVAGQVNILGDDYTQEHYGHNELYRAITFSGDLQIEYQNKGSNDTYTLSTKADSFSKDLIDITGKVLNFNTDTGYSVYLGVPKIVCHHPESSIYLGENEFGKSVNIAELYGRQVLRVKSNGKTLYRRKIAILPESFDLQLIPGQVSNRGTIKISSSQTFIYDVLNEIKTRNSMLNEEKCIEIFAEGAPPLHISLQIQANLLADPINLKVPFPARGALLFDSKGNELPKVLSVDELLGTRALLFKVANKSSTDFEIELKAPTSSIGNASYTFRYRVEMPVEEVNLYEYRYKIKELLATADSGQLDEVVRLIISSPSTTTKQYTIGWNAINAHIESNLLVFDEHEVEDFSDVKVELLNLANPEEYAERLHQRTSHGVPVGRFELPIQTKIPRLAVPMKDSRVKFRAVFIPPSEYVETINKAKSLEKAAMLYHPFYNKDAFNIVLDDMAMDINHSGWRYLDNLFSKYQHLPMLSFEAWKALSKHPACLTLLPFASKQKIESIMHVLQVEFNVVWELIPLIYWQKARRQYTVFTQSNGLPEELINKFVNEKTQVITNFINLPDLFTLDPKQASMYPFLIDTWRGELLINNADVSVKWPQNYSNAISSWAKNNLSKFITFQVPHEFQESICFFPLIAASVVAGKVSWSDVLQTDVVNYFLLRQLMDFDRDWFNSVFQCALCAFIAE